MFRSYLSNRKQMVDINGHFSPPTDINISVLQGSILGPILFLCFINDLSSATDLFTLLFADDTCALASNSNLPDLIQKCNQEINKIAIWLKSNKLAVNVGKCKFLIFHNKGKKIDLENLSLDFNFNDPQQNDPHKIIPLERIYNLHPNPELRSYKYLGILLDEYLSFNYHYDLICKKISKGLFCLKRAKNILNIKSLKSMYFALVHSHLLYCSLVVGCTSESNIKRVSILQKKQSELYPMLITTPTPFHCSKTSKSCHLKKVYILTK